MGQVNSTIKFQDTGYFSKIMSDYLEQKESVEDFYGNFPDIEGFRNQIIEKSKTFDASTREVLTSCLIQQTAQLKLSVLAKKHISLLKESNTFNRLGGIS